jgi:hypothetical protein
LALRAAAATATKQPLPAVTGKPVCGAGPWLRPSLDYAYKRLGVPNPSPDDEFIVVKTVLQQFKAMLDRIAADPAIKNFVVVPTQGTLDPGDTDWQNEIHPSTRGFALIAGRFLDVLNAQFPS